ncbi:MAG TPA: alpha/beta hydrolase [Candidatus Dormibacteraeota bacterium]|nr:alpha/beta hydrolase [Candidatus Dormibacteraeota bacterium]
MVEPSTDRPRWHLTDRDGVRLACADFGGTGTAVMLLHGLAGCADEWIDTASTLTSHHRVLAPDQRGHGRSERRPRDVSRGACVADVAMWLERLDAAPGVLVGQSLGGHTAFLVAARHPDLVRGLAVVEATPEANPRGRDDVRRWLATWPVPFASLPAAMQFFGGDTAWARAWARGLESRDDGYWPRFDADVMVACLTETAKVSYWEDWSRVTCPTLIVRGERGLKNNEVARMQDLVPSAQVVEIAGAGHDAHLERPEAWRASLDDFLQTSAR